MMQEIKGCEPLKVIQSNWEDASGYYELFFVFALSTNNIELNIHQYLFRGCSFYVDNCDLSKPRYVCVLYGFLFFDVCHTSNIFRSSPIIVFSAKISQTSWLRFLQHPADLAAAPGYRILFCMATVISPFLNMNDEPFSGISDFYLKAGLLQFWYYNDIPTQTFLVFFNHIYHPKSPSPNLWVPEGTQSMVDSNLESELDTRMKNNRGRWIQDRGNPSQCAWRPLQRGPAEQYWWSRGNPHCAGTGDANSRIARCCTSNS